MQVLRGQADDLLIVEKRAHPVVLAAPGIGPAVQRINIVRLQLQPIVEIGDGAVIVAFAGPDQSAIVEGSGILRVELDRLAVVPNGIVVLALVGICDTAIVVIFAILGIEADRLAEIGDRFVLIALEYPTDSTVVVAIGLDRIEVDHGAEIGDSAVIVMSFRPYIAALEIGDDMVAAWLRRVVDDACAGLDANRLIDLVVADTVAPGSEGREHAGEQKYTGGEDRSAEAEPIQPRARQRGRHVYLRVHCANSCNAALAAARS
ncbi:hypothetical protein [Mesorhizobium sp. WSM3859]|uniref:hypothetical protein n=1 Tax=Mesorhizobium sp. WSM3859 TaxID=2029402 RepID=UPI001FE01719|nr:hypothetical protein [Mesorhizobium sp. WSM3859]